MTKVVDITEERAGMQFKRRSTSLKTVDMKAYYQIVEEALKKYFETDPTLRKIREAKPVSESDIQALISSRSMVIEPKRAIWFCSRPRKWVCLAVSFGCLRANSLNLSATAFGSMPMIERMAKSSGSAVPPRILRHCMSGAISRRRATTVAGAKAFSVPGCESERFSFHFSRDGDGLLWKRLYVRGDKRNRHVEHRDLTPLQGRFR